MVLSTSIYLDNQASTPLDPRVRATLMEALDIIGNPHSSEHAHGWQAAAALEAARDRIALALDVDADEVVFTSGATEANNFAILGLCSVPLAKRNIVLLPETEHKCTLEAARAVHSSGFKVKFLKVHKDGTLDLDYLSSILSEDVALVSVMAVHNEIGTVQPLDEVVQLAHGSGALVHSDAVQLLSASGADSAFRQIDILSLSGHKIYGPKGIGLSIVRRDIQGAIRPLLRGGGQQAGLRSGTVPMPLCAALATAVELMTNIEAQEERERLSSFQRALWERLCASPYPIILNGPPLDNRHPGNLNVAFPDFAAHEIISLVQPHLAISSGSACSSGTLEPSHVLQALRLPKAILEGSFRIGLGRFTTEEHIRVAAELIIETTERLRKMTL